VVAGVVFGLVMVSLPGQTVPEMKIGPAQIEFSEGLTSIGSIRELRDGRVLVVDTRDAAVKLVDFARGTATPVGRQGAGPGEYRGPTLLLPLNGDTTLLVDRRQQRSIVILPGGVAGEVFLAGKDLVDAPTQARTPAATDGRGRIYFAGSSVGPNALPDSEPLDSVPIIRYDPATGRLDSLALVKVPKRDTDVQRVNGKITQVSVFVVPLRPHDDWTVLPDGTVLIVRTAPYRLDAAHAGGRLTQGAGIPNTPVLVTAAERKAATRFGVGFPRIKPPFDGPRTELAPDQRLWIRRTTAYTDSTARYDVIDFAGKLVARVALPPRTELAGFGRNVLYTVRRYEDDLEYLGRLPLPRI